MLRKLCYGFQDRLSRWIVERWSSNATSCKLEPAIWSLDTGQRILCFDSCQLTVTWMSDYQKQAWYGSCSTQVKPKHKRCFIFRALFCGLTRLHGNTTSTINYSSYTVNAFRVQVENGLWDVFFLHFSLVSIQFEISWYLWFTMSAMANESTQNKSEQHIWGRESLLREKDVFHLHLICNSFRH